jgi:HD-like signal output (HDOD) protein
LSDFVRSVMNFIDTLPAPSPALKHILAVLESPDSNTQSITEAVKLEPTISTKILKLANSAEHSSSSVLSLSSAVSLVGREKIHSITVLSDAVRRFGTERYSSFKFKQFMHHTVITALFAELLAERVSEKIDYSPDSFFSAGIVHNYGMLILNMVSSKHFEVLVKQGIRKKLPLSNIENIGESHAEMGALLLQKWGLPDEFVNVARYHHDPEGIYGGDILVDIIHVAEVVASISGGDIFDEIPVEPFCGNSLKRIGVTPDVIKEVRSEVLLKEKNYAFLWEGGFAS